MQTSSSGKRLHLFFFLLLLSLLFFINTAPLYAVERILILNFKLNSGRAANQWIDKALNLDLCDNLTLLHNFETVSFADKEILLKKLSCEQQQDVRLLGKALGATKIVSGELIEEKNSIILYGKIHDLSPEGRVIKFTVSGRTLWLSDFSENIAWQIMDFLNLRNFSPQDEERLRFKVKSNEQLRKFLNAELAFINGEKEEAYKLYLALRNEEPGLITTYLRLAYLQLQQAAQEKNVSIRNSIYDDTHNLLEQANKADPRHREVYYLLGKLFNQKSWIGRDDNATIEYQRKAISLFEHYTQAYRELAYHYAENLQQYEKAIDVLEKVIAYDPVNHQIENDIENIFKLSQGQKYIKR